jgi:hypothetical protein
MDDEQTQLRVKTVLAVLASLPVGALIGFSGTYWMATEGKRLEILQESRRDAYIHFLKVQVKKQLDLKNDPVKFVGETEVARRKLSIYGNKAVVEALARHWREIYNAPPCCGKRSQLQHDVAIYQSMRSDILPQENINDADMMLLQHLCKMPEPKAEEKPCQ